MGVVRKAKSVKSLLELFEQTNTALSALGLVERFQLKIDKTTLYRILDRQEDEGVVHSIKGEGWFAMVCNGMQDAEGAPLYNTKTYIRTFSVWAVVRRNVWI